MQTSRTHNQVVGIFHSEKEVDKAMGELHELGIKDDDIQVEDRSKHETLRTGTDDRGSILDSSVGSFFSRIFGLNSRPHQYTTPEYSAHFTHRLEDGDILVSVKTYEHWDQVIAIFNRYNALKDFDTDTELNRNKEELDPAEERVLKLRKEVLESAKKRHQTGEVVINKEVKTHNETVEVPLKKEEIVVERRGATGNHLDGYGKPIKGESEEIRIPVSEEKVEVKKKTVPKEDVVISKETHQDKEKVSAKLKEEEAKIKREHSLHESKDEEHRANP